MSSSNLQIGNVTKSLLFPAGSVFINTYFYTTNSPGNTTISAFASGYRPANLVVSTAKVGGIPSALEVFLSPSQIPPDRKLNSTVVVEAVDIFGNPVNLANDTTIFLSSSDSEIGNVSHSLVIARGQSFATTTFYPTYVAGQSIITASAPGFTSGSNVITTVGPTAGKLVVTVAPSIISTNKTETATVSIQLQDINSETPAIASSNVDVVITSSNTSVAQVLDPTITIPAGSSYESITISAGGSPGVANITAAAQGYLKSSALVQAVKTVSKVTPNKLFVSFAPGILLPNDTRYEGAVIVELQWVNQSTGTVIPAYSTSGVTVYVRSSNNQSMLVDPEPLTIPAGATHASLYVDSTFLPGTAEITAQSEGLTSDTEQLISSGLIPDALQVQFAPNILLSGSSSSVVIGLINNATGEPAKAPQNATVVTLISTNPSLVQVQHYVTIPGGKTYARANINTSSGVTGNVQVIASASGYISSNSTISLVTPAATNIGVYPLPDQLVADNQTFAAIAVQLQDSAGNPQKTDVPVPVSLTIDSPATGYVTPQVTIPPGSTFVLANVTTTTTTGMINVSAFANGFKPGNAGLSSIAFPSTAKLQTTRSALPFGSRVNLTLYVSSMGSPVSNASVNWPSNLGISNEVNSTNATGYATASFQAGSVPGNVIIPVKVEKPGFNPASSNVSISVFNPSPPVQTVTTRQTGILSYQVMSIPLVALIPVIVAVCLGSLFLLRRRRSASEDEGSEDAEEEE